MGNWLLGLPNWCCWWLFLLLLDDDDDDEEGDVILLTDGLKGGKSICLWLCSTGFGEFCLWSRFCCGCGLGLRQPWSDMIM